MLSRGPSPPFPSRPPPLAGDVRVLGPRPRKAGDQSAEDAGFWGEGKGPGPQGGRRGSQGEAAIGRKKGGFCLVLHPHAQSPGPTPSSSELRRLYSLVSDL